MKQLITIDDQAFVQIIEKLESLEKEVRAAKKTEGIGWLNNEQLCAALQISKRTAQNYRDQQLLPYSLIGGKVYYKVEDVERLLNKHYVKAK